MPLHMLGMPEQVKPVSTVHVAEQPLPLVVPPQCRFRVGSDTREWREGQAWVFDDTIEHEAWNDSEVPRAILIFDTWHPALTRAERELIRTAVPAIKDYYRDEVQISGSEG